MDNKSIRIRRSIYLVLVILSLVFVTFYGGNVPYMMFFLLLENALLSFLYIFYVFYSIRISQGVSAHGVDKGVYVDLTFTLANEGILPIASARLSFLKDTSEVLDTKELEHIGLNVNEQRTYRLMMVCKYSGLYYAGASHVEIIDYFGIFKIRFNMPQKLKVYVRPRIIPVKCLAFLDENENTINSSNQSMSDMVVDSPVRAYENGDDKNLIHWKNTAKTNKLMVRTRSFEEAAGYVLLFDTNLKKADELERIVVADKLREAYISVANYLYLKGFGVQCHIDSAQSYVVASRFEFMQMYEGVSNYIFIKETNALDILGRIEVGFGSTVIVVTDRDSDLSAYSTMDIVKFNVNHYAQIEDAFEDRG